MLKSSLMCTVVAAILLTGVGCSKEDPRANNAVENAKPLEEIIADGLDDSVLLRVNSRPITQYDFNLWQLATGMKDSSPKTEKELLDLITEAELMYQRGVELGLDKDPRYIRSFALAAAKTKLLRLQEMQEMVARYEAQEIVIDDEQARKYFEANESLIRSTYHLASLQFPNEGEAKAVLTRIRKGENFEKVAATVVENMPGFDSTREAREYWDMGFVSWSQIPPQVMAVVAKLKPGKVSEPIALDGFGYVVLKLLERGERQEADFSSMRAEIIARLRDVAVHNHLEKLRDGLKAKAKIEKVAKPLAVNVAPIPHLH